MDKEFLVNDEAITVDRIMADRLGLNGAIVYSCIMKEQTTDVNHLFNLMPFISKSTIKRAIANIKSEGYLQEKSFDTLERVNQYEKKYYIRKS